MATSRMTTLIALATAAVLTTAPALGSDVNAGTETVAAGSVSATLSWERGEFGPQETMLTIARNGAVAFQRRIKRVCGGDCQRFTTDGDDFRLADLDGDGEQEVVVTASNAGRCCTTIGVYDFRAATGTYGELVRDLRSSFELKDVDRDGGSEIVTRDGRFAGLLTSHGGWFLPPSVLKYERPGDAPRLTDVTRSSRAQIRQNAAEARQLFSPLRRPDQDALGYVGAYVADQYLLGRRSAGLRELDRQIARGIVGRPKAARIFRRRLLVLLHRYYA